MPSPVALALGVLTLLAALLGVALGLLGRRARRLEHEREDLTADVGLLQSTLLPDLPHRLGRAWVTAAYRPAEGLAAGGDFYDAFALDEDRTCLLVGDVAGHGRDAIPLTASTRYTLRAYVEAGLGPRAALHATAEVLGPRLAGRLITVVLAVYDARTGLLTYATAGHPPPLILGAGDPPASGGACPPLGAGVATGCRQTTVALPPGSAACFYTDGLTDVRVGSGRLGVDRLADHLRALGPRQGAPEVLARVVRESDEQPDDMAACVIRPMLGCAMAGRDQLEEMHVESLDEVQHAGRLLEACRVEASEAHAVIGAVTGLLASGHAVVVEVRTAGGRPSVAIRRSDPPELSVVRPL